MSMMMKMNKVIHMLRRNLITEVEDTVITRDHITDITEIVE